ncbi:zinc ribbon domain-containing protein [bacterium]|jgi:putative FmdB family regulatory protein|nr:zinc ribbon domain-containing protein [bacterium]
MPTYEYVCSECQNKFDVYATMAEKEKGLKPECPNCHSKKTIQVFGSVNFLGGSKGGFNSGSMPGCGPAAGPGCC